MARIHFLDIHADFGSHIGDGYSLFYRLAWGVGVFIIVKARIGCMGIHVVDGSHYKYGYS